MNRLVLMLIIALLAAACTTTGAPADDTPTSPDEPVASDGGRGDDDGDDRPEADAVLVIEQGVADGPGISVADALGWEGNPNAVLVNGALFVNDAGTVLLCDAIAESFPPQCGGARLLVEGLELAGIPDLEEANGVRWAESVQLFGRVEPAD